MNTNPITQLEQFRLEVYHSFDHRADATMEVLDALTGNTSARSVVELSLTSGFRRTYSSVYAAIGECFTITKPEHRRRREETLLRLITAYLAQSQRRKFWFVFVKRKRAHLIVENGPTVMHKTLSRTSSS